jgi:hypothetical protein
MNTPRSAIARHNARQAHTHEARSRLEWAAEVHAILEAAAATFDETMTRQQITVPVNRTRGPVQARGILDMCQALSVAGVAASTPTGDIILTLAGYADRMQAALNLARSYLEAEHLHLSRAHTDRPGVTLSPSKARRNTYGMLLSAAAEASTIIRTTPPFNKPLDREEVEATYAILSREWAGAAYREQPLPAVEEGCRDYERIYLSVAKTPLVKSYRKNQ